MTFLIYLIYNTHNGTLGLKPQNNLFLIPKTAHKITTYLNIIQHPVTDNDTTPSGNYGSNLTSQSFTSTYLKPVNKLLNLFI